MKHPTFDSNGYPTPATLRRIRRWPMDDWRNLIRFLREAWWPDFGRKGQDGKSHGFRWRGSWLRLATGGWSGNEEIVGALRQSEFWIFHWYKSVRGGLYLFALWRKEKL